MIHHTNHLFNEIKVGQSASLSKRITRKEVRIFAEITNDMNPLHLDSAYAKHTVFQKRVAHGFFTASLIPALLGTVLPGPGSIYLEQTLSFLRPVFFNDKIKATVTVLAKKKRKRIVVLECKCVNQKGKIVISGLATVMAPEEKIHFKKKKSGEVVII